jgi:hypothetical protein
MTDTMTTRFRVGFRYRCAMAIPTNPQAGMVVLNTLWSPHPPTRLSRQELADYRRGRDALLAELAKTAGPIVVGETGTNRVAVIGPSVQPAGAHQ